MSSRLSSRSPDLARLIEAGYELEIRDNHLLVHHIPFVNDRGQVAYGSLVCELTLQGASTAPPSTHVMQFIGGIPSDSTGARLDKMIIEVGSIRLSDSLTADCRFSQKPAGSGRYDDYYDKVVTYANMIMGHARVLDRTATATTFKPIATDEDESVFRYLDTASARAGITAYTQKLALPKIAIIGLGGTGGYVLDLLAKIPIEELHLYDGDRFYTHNAFRAPGGASIEELNEGPMKVEYFASHYDPMRRGVHPHPVYVTKDNIDELASMTFVFICMDANPDKKIIVERLDELDIPFIDTGMGILDSPTGLGGLVRTTTSLPGRRDHIRDGKLLSYSDDGAGEYDHNIQIADLNALAAALAVIRFKKHYGFYRDHDREVHSVYGIDGNFIVNTHTIDDEGEANRCLSR